MTQSQLISHAIAVLQVRQMGGARRWIIPELDGLVDFDFTEQEEAGLIKYRKADEYAAYKLTPAGFHLSDELIATAGEVL